MHKKWDPVLPAIKYLQARAPSIRIPVCPKWGLGLPTYNWSYSNCLANLLGMYGSKKHNGTISKKVRCRTAIWRSPTQEMNDWRLHPWTLRCILCLKYEGNAEKGYSYHDGAPSSGFLPHNFDSNMNSRYYEEGQIEHFMMALPLAWSEKSSESRTMLSNMCKAIRPWDMVQLGE